MRGTVVAFLLVTILVFPGCTTPSMQTMDLTVGQEDDAPTEACNGLLILCLRTYDNVTFPETHNAFSTHEDGIYYPASNHQTGLDAQWTAGMRAFMIDTHYQTLGDERVDTVRLCHGDDDRGFSPCTYGSVDSVEWLSNLRGKMEQSPRDVVTLLVENYVQADHLQAVFEMSGMYQKVFYHEINTPWPTLQELIEQNTTLVVFWEQGEDSNHPWIHDFLTHSWTTNFGEQNTEDMNCDLLRGDVEQEVFHMNNWLRGPLGLSDPTRGDEANDVDFLLDRAKECWQQHGKRPTFIAVDWWEDGDVVAAALAINQMDDWQ
ncbi:MAG: hypothetical protein CMA63_01185 [Euryarchaeota archaeon]|nr:hypothetical protein [Euryarchaeota archaeon]